MPLMPTGESAGHLFISFQVNHRSRKSASSSTGSSSVIIRIITVYKGFDPTQEDYKDGRGGNSGRDVLFRE